MIIPPALFPVLLTAHITLAISLFLPSFLLPFTMRTRARDGKPLVTAEPGRFVRLLLWLERNGTVIIGAGVAATGIGMLTILGATLLSQPWLLAGITIYATILVTSFFIQRPALRRLIGLRADATPEEQEKWKIRARRQRYISYGMAAGIGLIGWLMMAKPGG